eukprot:CAMPEP_0182514164 /NCGR_PEP_ID=MMETSP1321-20130603/35246_1 /TAXON_ID=91990 /ORGANISM="Bolidomonas sp., Strain RCC1657" /LENGTH=232 /DNA_ID=CAMNT_0024721291 /DNA_START=306 /DNA_END=1001 /DNA_ORIENTATION=-
MTGMLRSVINSRLAFSRLTEIHEIQRSNAGKLYHPNATPPPSSPGEISPLGSTTVLPPPTSLFNTCLLCLINNLPLYLHLPPSTLSSYLRNLPSEYTSLLSCFMSKDGLVDDTIILELQGSYDVEEIAFWGKRITDEGVESIVPRIVRDDDVGWEDSESYLRGFRNLRRLEVCDTCGVSLGALSTVLGSVYFKDTLEIVSFRNCAGMHQDDSEVDEEVHGRFVDRLVEGTWE